MWCTFRSHTLILTYLPAQPPASAVEYIIVLKCTRGIGKPFISKQWSFDLKSESSLPLLRWSTLVAVCLFVSFSMITRFRSLHHVPTSLSGWVPSHGLSLPNINLPIAAPNLHLSLRFTATHGRWKKCRQSSLNMRLSQKRSVLPCLVFVVLVRNINGRQCSYFLRRTDWTPFTIHQSTRRKGIYVNTTHHNMFSGERLYSTPLEDQLELETGVSQQQHWTHDKVSYKKRR